MDPARTACSIHVSAVSVWNGGLLEFQTTDGRPIQRKAIRPGVIAASVPANSRIVLSKNGLKSRMFYIAMENLEVERNISYLSSGEFRNDYPNLRPSELPPQAFHLDALRSAIQHFDYDLR
jgi:hypothetical protein